MIRSIAIALLLSVSFIAPAQHTISGLVSNESGELLDFASVFLKGTDFATYTDVGGYYELTDVPAGEYEIIVTFVGYRRSAQFIEITSDTEIDVAMRGAIYNIDSIEIKANRVAADGVFTHTNVDMDLVQDINLGQDMPVLLGNTTNMVFTSDAGAGIGYTGMRLRGSDQTRINVTINGIPWNDSESHGVFFVNLPDLATDASSIQIQRGVGTSTNGTGAFGGTVAVETDQINVNPYLSIGGMYGSFNSRRINARAGTGIIGDGYSVDVRFSDIASDGYIDRGSSDLQSYAVTASKISDKRVLRFNLISGDEVTYQSWYGAPESRVTGNQDSLTAHYQRNIGTLYNTPADSTNLFGSDRRYNYYLYERQVDDYGQRHLQLHWSELVSDQFRTKTSLFYTRGRGFFEEYKADESLVDDYGLSDVMLGSEMIDQSDVVRRRWLDNHFYGFNFSAVYNTDKLTLTSGAYGSQYLGGHFGDVFVVRDGGPIFQSGRRFYDGNGDKLDGHVYTKADVQLSDKLSAYADLQLRHVDYTIDGTDNDLQRFDVDVAYTFFNPKAGLAYAINNKQQVYASYARSNREPVRSDFTDNPRDNTPTPEQLDNFEAGYRLTTSKVTLAANLYYMGYTNQLIPTGALNDVGAVLRINTPESYRAGIELDADYRINEQWQVGGNVAVSRNRIANFTEVLEDYTNGFEIVTNTYEDTDIALSPDMVANARITFTPMENLQFRWLSQYVSSQYLDNTSNDSRKLDAYFVNDLQAQYSLEGLGVSRLNINLLVRNVLDAAYSANGYTYSYIFGDRIQENYLYPQAGRFFMLGLTVDL